MVGYRFFSLALLLLVLLPASAAANTRIIVQRDAGLSAAERADIRADADVRFVETLPLARTEVVTAAHGDVADALRDLNADPDVAYAERDRLIRAQAADPEDDANWGLGQIQAPDAWIHSTGEGRTVAVVDSGVDDDHPDLLGQVVHGYDWVNDDFNANDEQGHGTHVAGTIAAADNGDGVAGVAPDARILPLRVLDEAGVGFVSDAVKAYDYAADQGARIVNASLAGEGFMWSEHDAIEDHPEVLFVVAAGNGEGGDDDAGDDNGDPDLANYPCAYDLPNVLCVGASDEFDGPAWWSNFGETTVDVFAPGIEIESTLMGGGYGLKDGTSTATPHVAGMAALLLSQTPALTPEKVIEAVVEWADPSPDLAGLSVSDGRANARRAVELNNADGDGLVDGDDSCPLDPTNSCAPPPPDPDSDGKIGAADTCPDEPAAYATDGCPATGTHSDADSWPDEFDNCDLVSNPTQADADADGQGDACDATPRGPDVDGDGYGSADDQCPTVAGTAPAGCPAVTQPPPTVTPPSDRDGDGVYDVSDSCLTVPAATKNGCPLAQVASSSAKAKKRSVKVKVTTSRVATLRITVERKRGGRWVRVARKTIVTSGNRASLTVKGLKRGAHRVRISISSSAGSGTPVTRAFRVR
jgi:Subtilase family/Thrombospondin type 3 repeat